MKRRILYVPFIWIMNQLKTIKNINDDDFVTGQYTATQVQGLFQNRFFLDPQTYGLTFGYNF